MITYIKLTTRQRLLLKEAMKDVLKNFKANDKLIHAHKEEDNYLETLNKNELVKVAAQDLNEQLNT